MPRQLSKSKLPSAKRQPEHAAWAAWRDTAPPFDLRRSGLQSVTPTSAGVAQGTMGKPKNTCFLQLINKHAQAAQRGISLYPLSPRPHQNAPSVAPRLASTPRETMLPICADSPCILVHSSWPRHACLLRPQPSVGLSERRPDDRYPCDRNESVAGPPNSPIEVAQLADEPAEAPEPPTKMPATGQSSSPKPLSCKYNRQAYSRTWRHASLPPPAIVHGTLLRG